LISIPWVKFLLSLFLFTLFNLIFLFVKCSICFSNFKNSYCPCIWFHC